MIAAVTFDLWDTIVADDSDEPKRAALGLPDKPEARWRLFRDAVRAARPTLHEDTVRGAFDGMNAWFRHAWKVEHHTPPLVDRLRKGLDLLGLDAIPGFDAMVDGFARMEVDLPPDLAPGIRECLDALKGRYPLAIISDAIVTPGTGLRDLLRRYDLYDHFDVFVFSDEAGASKPSRKVFDAAAQGLGVPVTGLAHIGDRESNDVDGPLAVGATAVLYTGVIDRGSDATRAQAVCRHHDDLPAILDSLGRA